MKSKLTKKQLVDRHNLKPEEIIFDSEQSVQNSNPPYKPNPALPIAEQTAEELRTHNRKLETHIYSALGIKAE
ncbi:MAG: hypothetical protein PHN61_15500 [Methanothrix sp.]|nr:hypothetical protein [Methanothrix sp.]